ncbi:neuroligin-2-like [Tubulanus polymorphus]|uniref:neuroligin-2-like n=1 Tax=Tubulanus polymorphus TaxID=672921 RepID=UPI003DA2476E
MWVRTGSLVSDTNMAASRFLLGFVLIMNALWNCCEGADVTVDTPYAGNITGMNEQISGIMINKFLGIPYAEPPIRFTRPMKKARSSTTIQAKTFGNLCVQDKQIIAQARNGNPDPSVPQTLAMSEDCLTLNIYAPTDKTMMPVIIFIHGGDFTVGGSAIIDGRFISANNDIVFVTLNYRLGIFGFLSTDDLNSEGNYGLYDQQLAIKWVKDNVQAFGGNPKSITVMGNAAGSISAIYQSVTHANKGMFQRIIALNGGYSTSWAVVKEPMKYARKAGDIFNCSNESAAALITCLKGQNITTLQNGMDNSSHDLMWGPVVDGNILTDDLLEELSSDDCNLPRSLFGMVDALIGANTEVYGSRIFEKILAANSQIDNGTASKDFFDSVLIPYVLKGIETDDVDSVKKRLTDLYADDGIISRENAIQMITDRNFVSPSLQTALIHAEGKQRKNSYLYTYDYVCSTTSRVAPFGELNQLLAKPGNGTVDHEMTRILQIYWTNFAKTGNPNRPVNVIRKWPMFTTKRQIYVHLSGSSKYGIVIHNSQTKPRHEYTSQWLHIFGFERDYLKMQSQKQKSPVAVETKFPPKSTSCKVPGIRLGGPYGPYLKAVEVEAIVLGLSLATGLGIVLFIILFTICCGLLRSVKDLKKSTKAEM